MGVRVLKTHIVLKKYFTNSVDPTEIIWGKVDPRRDKIH